MEKPIRKESELLERARAARLRAGKAVTNSLLARDRSQRMFEKFKQFTELTKENEATSRIDVCSKIVEHAVE